MHQQEVRRNIFLYRMFVLFSEPLFWGPVLIVSLQKLGHMSLPDIYFLESAAVAVSVVLDIPAGALADVVGKKAILIVGRVFLFASICGFALMSSPVWAWVANMFWAIGFAFQSGTDVSLIYGNLKSGGYQKLFRKIEGRATGGRFMLMALGALAVSGLAGIQLRLPVMLCVPFAIVPLVISFKFSEPVKTETYGVSKQVQTLKDGMQYAIHSPQVRWVVLFYAFIAGTSKIWFFTYNPYFETVGISIAWYGFIFFLLNIVAWSVSFYAHTIAKKVHEKTSIVLMSLCIGVPILLMGLIPLWPLAYLVLFQNVVRGFMRPFLGDLLNRHIASERVRTTVLSVQSSTTNVVSIGALAWFGFMTKQFSLLPSLSILGALALILGTLQVFRYRKLFLVRVRKKKESIPV